MKKNELNLEELDKVSGGLSGDDYGDSYSGKESETIPPGTKLIYTDSRDRYLPHRCTYVRYAGDDRIVLKPDDKDCYLFFEACCIIPSNYKMRRTDNGTAYEIVYTWYTGNHLYNA